MNLLTFAANNLHVPFLTSIALYLWIAIGKWAMGDRWTAGAWIAYAAANLCFWQAAAK